MRKQTEVIDQSRQTTLLQDLIALSRYALMSRRGFFIIAGILVMAGLFSGWDWLVAAGLAPILLGVLPCAAMCAAGVCMNRKTGSSCSSSSDDQSKANKNLQTKGGTDALDSAPGVEIEKP